jgi:hypothetical protein
MVVDLFTLVIGLGLDWKALFEASTFLTLTSVRSCSRKSDAKNP